MRSSLGQVGRDAGAGLAEARNGRHGLVEHLLLGLVQVDLDDALDAACADHGRDADIHVGDAVLPGEMGRAGEHALLVLEIGLGHAMAEEAGA